MQDNFGTTDGKPANATGNGMERPAKGRGRGSRVPWSVVLSNLAEARGEVRELCAVFAYLETGKAPEGWEEFVAWRMGKGGFSTAGIAIQFEHAYQHVDFAWNCRHADEERARRCDQRDFDRWEKFPKKACKRAVEANTMQP